jgi:hypothetical protein
VFSHLLLGMGAIGGGSTASKEKKLVTALHGKRCMNGKGIPHTLYFDSSSTKTNFMKIQKVRLQLKGANVEEKVTDPLRQNRNKVITRSCHVIISDAKSRLEIENSYAFGWVRYVSGQVSRPSPVDPAPASAWAAWHFFMNF